MLLHVTQALPPVTFDPTQLRHLSAFPVLSCFLHNEVRITPYSLCTDATFIIQDLDFEE